MNSMNTHTVRRHVHSQKETLRVENRQTEQARSRIIITNLTEVQ